MQAFLFKVNTIRYLSFWLDILQYRYKMYSWEMTWIFLSYQLYFNWGGHDMINITWIYFTVKDLSSFILFTGGNSLYILCIKSQTKTWFMWKYKRMNVEGGWPWWSCYLLTFYISLMQGCCILKHRLLSKVNIVRLDPHILERNEMHSDKSFI